MKKKPVAVFWTAVWLPAALAALWVCGKTGETPGNTAAPQAVEAALPAQDPRQTPGTHRTETLCDGLAIDADLPVQEDPVPAYQADYFRISVADAVFLLAGGSRIETQEPHHYDPNGFTLGLENGAQIFHANGILTYCSETEDRDREIAELLSSYGEMHREEEVHALSFLSPDEAVEKASALIGGLDVIGEPVLDTMIGLSGTEILAWQNERMADESYSQWADMGKTTVLEDLTSADDAYYISFYFTYQDLPVFDQDREPGISFASDNFLTNSMKANVLITPRGVRYFRVENALSAQGDRTEAQRVISVQEALEKLCEKQENTVTFGTQLITRVWLEYIPIRAQNAVEGVGPFVLKPYWCFGMVDAESDGGRIVNADRIDAVTGEDLAYEY